MYSNAASIKAVVNVYPNPVLSGSTFAIEITGAEEEDLKGAVLRIYNLLGNEVYSSDKVKTLNYLILNGQFGNYVIHITTTEGKELSGKLIMAK
jgi:hypothetical protein